MEFKLRSEFKVPLKKIIVKVGSAALAADGGGLSGERIADIVSGCVHLWAMGIQCVVVSSGAILAGRPLLERGDDPAVTYLQACSAIGQPQLLNAYSHEFKKFGKTCAQVLLTHEDLRHRIRSLNLKNMMNRLINAGVTPILNENDSVSFAEITVGDNDQLAAMVASMLEVDCLVILSSPDGLYNQDPTNDSAKPLSTQGDDSITKDQSFTVKVPFVNYRERFENFSLTGKSPAGRGGMATKLEAVRKVTPLGIPVIIATFKRAQPLLTALSEGGGTFFEGHPESESRAKKRWLVTLAKTNASIRIDSGARKALRERGSLLPSGIVGVDGDFKRGDCIKILNKGQEVAIGLAEYASDEMRLLRGHQTSEIEAILGYCASKVAVHRDNLVLKDVF